jgi:regulator of protease activity HflC (stomatin/prohibitin superfamily)
MATLIKTSTTGIVTTFGKFSGLVSPGLKFYIPFVQKVIHVSNKTQQKVFELEVYTKDRVFAKLNLAIQYKIATHDTDKAYFSLDDPISQMGSYVENSIRSETPKVSLKDLFESFDTISSIVSKELSPKMSSHGYTIENILMTGIEPDTEVAKAISRIGASERLKEAAINEAEAEYIKKVKEAEADRDRKILQGQGIAGQRKAILDGYKETIANLIQTTGLTPSQIMDFMLKSQSIDTNEQIGKGHGTKVLFMDKSSPSIKSDIISSLESTDNKSESWLKD